MVTKLLCTKDSSIITSFKVTGNSTYLIYSQIDTAGGLRGSLHLLNTKNGKTVSIDITIHTVSFEPADPSLFNKIEIIDTPTIRRNLVEKKSFIVLNTGNGILLLPLEHVFGLSKEDDVVAKWYLSNRNDRILSFVATGLKNGSIEVWLCTKLGYTTKVTYSITSGKFQESRQLANNTEDSLSCISTGFKTFERWQENIGPLTQFAMSCYDNTIYWFDNDRLEKQNITQACNYGEGAILTSITFAIVKQLRTTSLVFFCGSVANVGCVLYKRNTRGDWDFVHTFERRTEKLESSPLVNCELYFDGCSTLTVVSGSECGKIFQWIYDYKMEVETVNRQIEVAGSDDTVHNLQLMGESSVFFLRNRSELLSVNI